MKRFRYYVYMEQEDLDTEIPSYQGTVSASCRSEAESLVDNMFPGSYYFYCIL